jgi:hypothetical protein
MEYSKKKLEAIKLISEVIDVASNMDDTFESLAEDVDDGHHAIMVQEIDAAIDSIDTYVNDLTEIKDKLLKLK